MSSGSSSGGDASSGGGNGGKHGGSGTNGGSGGTNGGSGGTYGGSGGTYGGSSGTHGGNENGGMINLADDGGGGGGGSDEGGLTCSICSRQYSHPTALMHHMKVHEGRTTCPLCGKVLGRTAQLRSHMVVVHKLSRTEVRSIVPTRHYTDWSRVFKEGDQPGGAIAPQQGELQRGQVDLQTGQVDLQTGQADLQTGQADLQTGQGEWGDGWNDSRDRRSEWHTTHVRDKQLPAVCFPLGHLKNDRVLDVQGVRSVAVELIGSGYL